MKKESNQEKPTGLVGALWNFLKTLEDMEKKGLREQVTQGTVPGPFDSKVHYSYRVRVGSLGLRPGSSATHGKARKPATLLALPEEKKEALVDVFEGTKDVHVVMELPGVRTVKDVDVKLKNRDLRVKAQSTDGVLEKTIPMPQTAFRIKRKAFKNGILDVVIEKRGREK